MKHLIILVYTLDRATSQILYFLKDLHVCQTSDLLVAKSMTSQCRFDLADGRCVQLTGLKVLQVVLQGVAASAEGATYLKTKSRHRTW